MMKLLVRQQHDSDFRTFTSINILTLSYYNPILFQNPKSVILLLKQMFDRSDSPVELTSPKNGTKEIGRPGSGATVLYLTQQQDIFIYQLMTPMLS